MHRGLGYDRLHVREIYKPSSWFVYCTISGGKECSVFQRAKKVVSDSPGLVDFAIGLVTSVFNLPDGQVMFFEEFK